MISIIICSRKKSISQELSDNIFETIGSDFEFIIIDNSENKYSIFEAYNIGIKRSKGTYLCFVHDDVLFHTQAWGKIICQIFESDSKIGLIGVAGAKLKTKMPSGWWGCPGNFKAINILQHTNGEVERWYYGFKNTKIENVIAIDGVFMVLKKENKIKFNETIDGYHNYDLNISLENYINGYKTVVTNEILLEHFSNGNINKLWYSSTYKIHEIYRKLLPISIHKELTIEELQELEHKNGFHFLKYFSRFGFSLDFFKLWAYFVRESPSVRKHKIILKSFIKAIVRSDH